MVSIVSNVALAAGHHPVVVVVPPDSSAIVKTLGEAFQYAVQNNPLGTGDALLHARDAVVGHDNALVMNADVPLIRNQTLSALTETHVRSECPVTMLTSIVADPSGLGRVVRDTAGRVTAVVEQIEADTETLMLDEVNVGVYCFRTEWLWRFLPGVEPSCLGEVYLTKLIEHAASSGGGVATHTVADPIEALGINNRVELSTAESVLRERIRRYWMLEGVSMADPQSVYIDYDVEIGIDTTVLPNTHLLGRTIIGEECEIGPNSIIDGTTVGDRSQVIASVIEGSTLESDVTVGPFSHLRAGSHLETGVHIGNFGEVKNSRIGSGTKSGHFSYIGDARVGSNVNFGAGSITCNFDGENKHETVIGNDVFIGSDTMLVAPVTIGARSYTAAGSVVNRDVPPDSGAIGAPARIRSKLREQAETSTENPASPESAEN